MTNTQTYIATAAIALCSFLFGVFVGSVATEASLNRMIQEEIRKVEAPPEPQRLYFF